MNLQIIISLIIFIFFLVFIISKFKSSDQEYGQELKNQKESIPAPTTEADPKNKKIIIVAILGILILAGGILYIFFKNKNAGGNEAGSSSNYFPFWLVALIPIFAQNKKKWANLSEKEKKAKYILIVVVALLVLLGMVVFFLIR